VLELERVGVQDDFLDLGGHSLTAMQVISRIGESFRVELSMSEFFSGLCIAELVERILRGRQQTTPTPARVERNGALPVSFTQERLWLLNQLHPDSDAYHMPIAFRVQGSLNRLALERALNELIRRHEILRTVYAFSNDLVQTVLPDSPIQLPMTDLSLGVAGQLEGKLRQVYEAEARGPFDLATGLLMRARLVRLEESGHALLTVFHHIVSDGWSLNLFFKELSFYYDCFASRGELRSLPALGLQYADYAQWQRHYVRGIGLQEDLAYWKNHLLGAPEEVRWPSINASVEPGYNKAVRCAFTIPAKTVQGATILAQAHRLTPFMVLLTSLAITLYKWSEQDDMVIGTVVAGRNRREWERVLGCFMNFLNPNSRIDSLGPDARCAGGRF
jgi:acyl carrier protein